jgi:hypothetical protein
MMLACRNEVIVHTWVGGPSPLPPRPPNPLAVGKPVKDLNTTQRHLESRMNTQWERLMIRNTINVVHSFIG